MGREAREVDMERLISNVAALAVIIVALAGCLGEREVDPVFIGGDQCLNAGGTFLRCAELVDGDCDGSPYLQWRSLAPADGEWHFNPDHCGSHEGSWLPAPQLGGQVIIHRVTTITETDRMEDWLVQLIYDGELCFERYAVRYVSPEAGCEPGEEDLDGGPGDADTDGEVEP